MSQVRLLSAFLYGLWAGVPTCLAASPCENIASLAASHIADSDAYTELQELLIDAESARGPGIVDKLTAEFQTKLSEYHAKLVATDEFTGSLKDFHEKVAKDARATQEIQADANSEHQLRKKEIRVAEDEVFQAPQVIVAGNPRSFAESRPKMAILNATGDQLFWPNTRTVNRHDMTSKTSKSVLPINDPMRTRYISQTAFAEHTRELFISNQDGSIDKINTTDSSVTPISLEYPLGTIPNLLVVNKDGTELFAFLPGTQNPSHHRIAHLRIAGDRAQVSYLDIEKVDSVELLSSGVLSKDESTLYVTAGSRLVAIDLKTGDQRTLQGTGEPLGSLDISPDGKTLIFLEGLNGGALDFFDLTTLKFFKQGLINVSNATPPLRPIYYHARFSPRGDRIFVLALPPFGAKGQFLMLEPNYERRHFAARWIDLTQLYQTAQLLNFSFSPNGRSMFLVDEGGTISRWSLKYLDNLFEESSND